MRKASLIRIIEFSTEQNRLWYKYEQTSWSCKENSDNHCIEIG